MLTTIDDSAITSRQAVRQGRESAAPSKDERVVNRLAGS